MAIDINEDVKVWGGFNPQDFWLGVSVLTLLAFCAIAIGCSFTPLAGGIYFFLAGGGFTGFMVYRQSQPKGLLKRRFLQDGSFLFLKFPGIRGIDVYSPVCSLRRRRFDEAFEKSHDHS